MQWFESSIALLNLSIIIALLYLSVRVCSSLEMQFCPSILLLFCLGHGKSQSQLTLRKTRVNSGQVWNLSQGWHRDNHLHSHWWAIYRSQLAQSVFGFFFLTWTMTTSFVFLYSYLYVVGSNLLAFSFYVFTTLKRNTRNETKLNISHLFDIC